MIFRIFSALTLIALIIGCNNDDDPIVIDNPVNCSTESVPNCILETIETFKTSSACPSTAAVVRYNFQNSCYFVFQEGDCVADYPNNILNDNCDTVGSDGGFSPEPVIINGESFNNAVLIDTIWTAKNDIEIALAKIRWTGEVALDGCGYQILINEAKYKPVNESKIPDSFKSVVDSSVCLSFIRGSVENNTYCGFDGPLVERKIAIIEIKPFTILTPPDTIWYWQNR